MNSAPLLEITPLPVAEFEPDTRSELVPIPLSAVVEADLSDSDMQLPVAAKVPCTFPSCQANGKVCTAEC